MPETSPSSRYLSHDPAVQPGAGGKIGGRPLADEIDRGRRKAGRRNQAVGAVHRIDPVVDGGVDVAIDIAVGERLADTVGLEIGDVEAARRVVGAVGFDLFDGDAGGGSEHVIDAGQPEIVHLRPRDDRDGLRRFAQRQVEAGGRGALAGGVEAGLFGARCVVGVAGDGDGGETLFFGGRRFGGQAGSGAERGDDENEGAATESRRQGCLEQDQELPVVLSAGCLGIPWVAG